MAGEQARAQASVKPCEDLKARIIERHAEFEKLWQQMSGGDAGSGARYRELRHELNDLRSEFRRGCGELIESSSLPPSILADWRQ